MTLRSEAEAPFRSVRLLLFGFSVVSAGVGFVVSIPQLIGALGGAPNALPRDDVLTNIAVNLGAVGIFSFLFNNDWEARKKQISRLTREERLGALGLQLANGKKLSVGALRGNARIVLVAGTKTQVAASLEAAEPFKEELVKRGVLVVPLPLFATPDETAELPPLLLADLRWRAQPLQLDGWQAWFSEQLSLAKTARPETGLFVGLRLDGRVRSSGSGTPPWRRYALELAPLEGKDGWTGFFDGFDGRV